MTAFSRILESNNFLINPPIFIAFSPKCSAHHAIYFLTCLLFDVLFPLIIIDIDNFVGDVVNDMFLIEERPKQQYIYLYGRRDEVEAATSRIKSALNDIDRKVRQTHKIVCLKSAARMRLLQSMGTFETIENKFTDLKIRHENDEIKLIGVPEDINEAELELHTANNELIAQKVPHKFSSTLVDFLHHSKVIDIIKEQLNEKHITAEFEVADSDFSIFVPAGRRCEDVVEIMFEFIKEETICLEKESLLLLKDQLWEDLNEDITERYENTADVSVDDSDQVRVVGLKDDVMKAKEQLSRFFDENTIGTECIPLDQLTQKFITRYCRDEVADMEERLSEHHVSILLRGTIKHILPLPGY